MIKSTDIVKVLTAAAPIVATLANMVKSENKKENEKEEPPVNVTINNTFYTNSDDDAIRAANIIREQAEKAYNSKTRYLL